MSYGFCTTSRLKPDKSRLGFFGIQLPPTCFLRQLRPSDGPFASLGTFRGPQSEAHRKLRGADAFSLQKAGHL